MQITTGMIHTPLIMQFTTNDHQESLALSKLAQHIMLGFSPVQLELNNKWNVIDQLKEALKPRIFQQVCRGWLVLLKPAFHLSLSPTSGWCRVQQNYTHIMVDQPAARRNICIVYNSQLPWSGCHLPPVHLVGVVGHRTNQKCAFLDSVLITRLAFLLLLMQIITKSTQPVRLSRGRTGCTWMYL